jgi:hypothetical protein
LVVAVPPPVVTLPAMPATRPTKLCVPTSNTSTPLLDASERKYVEFDCSTQPFCELVRGLPGISMAQRKS